MKRVVLTSTEALATFFIATFAITWPCFIAVARLSKAGAGNPGGVHGAAQLVLFVGIFAPALVAVSLTIVTEGAAGLPNLLEPLFAWRVHARWYLFAITYMAVIKLSVAVVHRIAVGFWPRFGTDPWYVIIAATFGSVIVGGQSGEEIGWRGYALPRLATRFGFPIASVLLGVVWALWHLPLFFVIGADTQGQSFVVYGIQVVALSVAITWLYLRVGRSLLLVMLMHSAINQSKDIVPSATDGAHQVLTSHASLVAWLTATLLWVCAAYFLVRMQHTPDLAPGLPQAA
jgi:uncharacterized protein